MAASCSRSALLPSCNAVCTVIRGSSPAPKRLPWPDAAMPAAAATVAMHTSVATSHRLGNPRSCLAPAISSWYSSLRPCDHVATKTLVTADGSKHIGREQVPGCINHEHRDLDEICQGQSSSIHLFLLHIAGLGPAGKTLTTTVVAPYGLGRTRRASLQCI